jgi:hypothetical protein
MGYGIKVSKTGSNANKNENLVIDSRNNCLKLADCKTSSITTDGSGIASKTVFHGLGFVPVVVCILDYLDSYYFVPFQYAGSLIVYLRITNSDFTIKFTDIANPNKTFNFYYFLSETESAE